MNQAATLAVDDSNSGARCFLQSGIGESGRINQFCVQIESNAFPVITDLQAVRGIGCEMVSEGARERKPLSVLLDRKLTPLGPNLKTPEVVVVFRAPDECDSI